DVNFTTSVELTRLADRVNADLIVGRFAQNRKTIVGMEGHGHVTMSMSAVAAPGENLGGRKDITCDRFYSDVGPDGQIIAMNAVGDTALAHAVMDGPPKRDLLAKTFRVAIANRAVTELKANG